MPGFTAASVWMNVTNDPPLSSGNGRPKALMTPAVTLFSNPNGEPMAIAHWPGRSFEGSPKCTTGKSVADILIKRDIAALVDADDLGAKLAPIRQLDRDLGGIRHHVSIGEHVAVGTDDEPGADAMGGRHVLGARRLEPMEELRQRILLVPLLAPEGSGPFCCGFSTTLILTTAAPFSATRPEKSGKPVTRPAGAAGTAGAATAGAGAAPTSPALAFERW